MRRLPMGQPSAFQGAWVAGIGSRTIRDATQPSVSSEATRGRVRRIFKA